MAPRSPRPPRGYERRKGTNATMRIFLARRQDGGFVTHEPDPRPIAHGTWDDRKENQLPAPNAERFSPVDTRPEGKRNVQRALDAQSAQMKIMDRSGPPVLAMLQYLGTLASDAYKDRKREKAALVPYISVREAAGAATAYRYRVLRYALGPGVAYGELGAQALTDLLPDAAGPLETLAAAGDLRDSALLGTWSEGHALTVPLLTAARDLHTRVTGAFRPVPCTPVMPWIGAAVTTSQRAQALRKAAALIDAQVASWYSFAFRGPEPADPLTAVIEHLAAAAEWAPLAAQHRRCLELAAADRIFRQDATSAVKELAALLDRFDESCYRSAEHQELRGRNRLHEAGEEEPAAEDDSEPGAQGP